MQQASIGLLSPVLFLIYINDLDIGILSWIFKFADDTKILSRVKSTEERNQKENQKRTRKENQKENQKETAG